MKNQNKPVKKLQLQKLKIASLSNKQMRQIYGGAIMNGTVEILSSGGPQGGPVKDYTNTMRICASGANGCGTNTCNC